MTNTNPLVASFNPSAYASMLMENKADTYLTCAQISHAASKFTASLMAVAIASAVGASML